jgi:hypothetical protein
MRSLAQLLELPNDDLRRQVESGEAPDRLRAAWAIALRFGPDSTALLREVALGEVPEGLRQQLVVVLAGLGERRSIAEIARRDPSDSVRAVATAYVIRTAPSPSEAISFAQRKLEDASSEVRVAVLEEVVVGRLALDGATLERRLRAPEEAERTAALVALIALAGRDPAAEDRLATLVEVGGREVEGMVAGLGRTDVLALLRALRGATGEALARVVRSIPAEHLGLGWEDVAFLWESRDDGVRALVQTIRERPPARALPGIVHAYLSGGSEGRWRAWGHLVHLLDEGTVRLLSPVSRSALLADLHERRAAIESALAETDEDDFEDALADYRYELELIEQLRAVLGSTN